MKRVLLAIIVISVFFSAAFAFFPDVPKDHWAYEYVWKLWQRGIFIGYPDGEFKGDRYITRYEAATAVSRLLDFIEQKMLAGVSGNLTQVVGNLSDKYMALEEKVNSLTSVLDTLAAQIGNTQVNFKDANRKVLEKIDSVKEELEQKLTQEISLNREVINNIGLRLGNLSRNYERYKESVDTKISEVNNKLANLEKELSNKIADLEGVVNLHEKDIINIYNKIASVNEELNKKIAATEEKLSGKDEEISAMVELHEKDIINLYNKISALNEDLNKKILDTKAELSAKIESQEKTLNMVYTKLLDVESKLSGEIDALKEKDAEIQRTVDLHEQDIINLYGKTSSLEEDLNLKYNETNEKIDQVKAELESKIESVKAYNRNLSILTGAFFGILGLILLAISGK
ncbi:S-layer homology domain-containing protein [Thermotoga sp.]|uniref:outer membrane anchor protein OmpA1 n=1 Tax=Thermotoga sp. TaxID=28240 RepID=UPI0025EE2085|nr:S-layer homology domain-containing protein [Thermotoga sp.]MCD6550803.1 S-layer homology domain-containing protein [Thermotoga sp.]